MSDREDSARLGFVLILTLCVFLTGFLLGGCAQELKMLREIQKTNAATKEQS